MAEINKLSQTAPHCLDELYNFSLIMTGSRTKAKKMLLKIIHEAADYYRYHQPDDIRNWLLRIALNIYNRFFLFNEGKNNQEIDAEIESLTPRIDKIIIEDFFKNLTGQDLLKLLASVPSDLRMLLTLKEVLNLNYDHMGELVGIPEGTLIIRLNRARIIIFLKAIGYKNG
jgi:DNA-directed RNA polymerase specialized sigma24 family protein